MQKYMNGLGLLERRCGLAVEKMFYECMNAKIFFRIWRNICLREKILPLAGENFAACGRKIICLREKFLPPAEENFAACIKK